MSADVAPRALPARTRTDEVTRLAMPAIGQQLVVALLFVADRALVGRLGALELASLHAATTIAWTAISLLSAVAIGALAAVGRRSGARDAESAAHAVRSALLFAVALALAVVAPAMIARETLVRALAPQDDPAIVKLALDYLEVVLCAVPMAAASAAASACLQARGDARTPFFAGAAAAVINLVLSALLVPVVGVRGAGIGTAFALGAQCLWLVIALRRDWWGVRATRGPSRELARVTAAAFGEKIVFHAGYLAYAAMIAVLGSQAAAANQAVLGIEAIGYPVAEGFAVAAAVLVARKLGGREPREARRAAVTAAALASCALGGFALVIAVVPDAGLNAFIADPAVVAEARSSLYVAAAAQPFMAFAVVTTAALRGAGRCLSALGITLLSAVGVRLGATWFFGFELDMGLTGAWLGSGLDWVVQALLAAWLLHREARHSKLQPEDVAFLHNRNRPAVRGRS